MKAEYTLPGISQSVVITRMAGRTPVPEKESIRSFAAHQATMVLFLSTGMLEKLSEELVAGGYQEETPAAIVYKATWPEEKVMHCTVGTLAETAEREKVTKTALIVVGNVLNTEYERSNCMIRHLRRNSGKEKKYEYSLCGWSWTGSRRTDDGQSGEDTGGVSCDPWIYGIY